jgi:hypothetical protein
MAILSRIWISGQNNDGLSYRNKIYMLFGIPEAIPAPPHWIFHI